MPVNKGKLSKPCSASDSFSKVKLCFYRTHTMSRGLNSNSNKCFPSTFAHSGFHFSYLSPLLSSTDFAWHIRQWLCFGDVQQIKLAQVKSLFLKYKSAVLQICVWTCCISIQKNSSSKKSVWGDQRIILMWGMAGCKWMLSICVKGRMANGNQSLSQDTTSLSPNLWADL